MQSKLTRDRDEKSKAYLRRRHLKKKIHIIYSEYKLQNQLYLIKNKGNMIT